MAVITPPAPGTPGLPRRRGAGRPLNKWLLLLIIPALLILTSCYVWCVQRVEVKAGQVLVLVRKVGQDLPPEAGDQVVLYPALLKKLGQPPDSTRYKGVMYQTLSEGFYFYDPLLWERIIIPAVNIEQREVGILVRKYGTESLPPGQIVATSDDQRGPLPDVLKPGRYNINPYAYEIERDSPVFIQEGYVGVQTLYTGREPANPNQYVVSDGERGVQPKVLPPGMYYNNRFVRSIVTIDVRSQTLDLRGDEAIHFPSNDSFQVTLDGTVEYAVRQDMAPYVMVAIGKHADVAEKLILPYTKSLARIEGSKLLAREFISGEARSAFQQRVFEGLRDHCYEQGVEIRAMLIRQIVPPAEIASPISGRRIAGEQIKQYHNEIELARAEANLVTEQEMQKQNQAVGEAERDVVSIITEAEQHKAVALTEANKRLEVTKLALKAAAETASAILARGQAEADVARLKYQAEAEPLRDAVAAFGGGELYAQFFFYQKLGPALKTILASTEGVLADIFKSLSAESPSTQTQGSH